QAKRYSVLKEELVTLILVVWKVIMSARCVACGWTNHFYGKDATKFFRFPSKLMYPEKRDAWVAAVRRVHPDGSVWEPSGDCQICSAHFITGDRAAPVGDTNFQFKATKDIWFKCCFCAFVTTDQHGIMSHLVSHGDEQFKCQRCPVLFDCMSELQCHFQVHTSDKSFKCPSSPRISLTEQFCLTHLRTYKCPRCHIAFKERGNLTDHIRTHLAEKSYKCKQCLKVFTHSSSRAKHSRTHTGE
ncbi:unnamed protein product, partial [Ixodes persulcatus]